MQKQVVLKRLQRYGRIANYWAVHNYILRLGAIIHTLRKEGYTITGEYSKIKGQKKNYIYKLAK